MNDAAITLEKCEPLTEGGSEKRNQAYFFFFYVSVALFFVALSPKMFTSSWIGSSDFHASIELLGSLVAMIGGLSCLIFFFGRRNRFYLIVGLGFFIAGSESFVHGILGLENFMSGRSIEFSKLMPGTNATGMFILAALIIAAPYLEHFEENGRSVKREALFYSAMAVAVGAGLAGLVPALPLPTFVYPDRLISRPVDLVLAIAFLYAFLVILRRFVAKDDIFSGMLLGAIVLNLGGQIYMSFSKQLFDLPFYVAHISILISYFMPILGISLQGLEEMEKAQRELEERKRMETNLACHAFELERANRELITRNGELDEFTYVASHDLQEPLRKLTSFCQLLQKDVGDDLSERVAKDMHFIIDASERMKKLIQDLLSLSRAGRTAMKREGPSPSTSASTGPSRRSPHRWGRRARSSPGTLCRRSGRTRPWSSGSIRT